MGRFLIVAAFPYIDGVKHLGNLAGSMLPADIQARFRRQQGCEVLFICGTDEHGSTAELAALLGHEKIEDYCDRNHNIQAELYAAFNLSFDVFGRTSGYGTRKVAQDVVDRLELRGLIEERVVAGLFSKTDGRLLADRLVGGVCPHCAYERARGDQCEACFALLDPEQLTRPISSLSGSDEFELRPTTHLFFRLSVLQPDLQAWLRSVQQDWSRIAVQESDRFLQRGLADTPITRDLSWGAPILKDGRVRSSYEEKVYYFWFDAPLGPIGAAIDWSRAAGGDWRRWWRTDHGAGDVVHIQFVGKDNVPFLVGLHSGALIGTREAWKRIDRLKAFDWLTWYGHKFSTRDRRGIFMDEAIRLLPADYWRWCLTVDAPEYEETEFTIERLRDVVNGDLCGLMGGFVERVCSLCNALDDVTNALPGPFESALADQSREYVAQLTAALEALEYQRAASALKSLWRAGHAYLDAREQAAARGDAPDAAIGRRTALNFLALLATVSRPFIPSFSDQLFEGLPDSCTAAWPGIDENLLDRLPHDVRIQPKTSLFTPICERDVEAWRSKQEWWS